MNWYSRFAFGALLIAIAGCGGGGGGKQDGGSDARCTLDAGARRANGQACGCGADCQSGFCVDGVCCNSACTETCKTCNDQSAPGICSFVPNGVSEQSAACAASPATSCGFDGTCDGQGDCRKYPAGTVCKSGTCDGAAIGNVNVCDGQGRCRSGPAMICAPYNCDSATNKCVSRCTSDADCAPGIVCVNGSCGRKRGGAPCSIDSDCGSNFCTDGVCCNVACKGPCVACNQDGRPGVCWPVDVGRSDPHGMCAAEAAATCGTTGACDGLGGCARYAPETVCLAPSCSGDRLNTAGTCDGLGTCRTPSVQNCAPYKCASGACISRCTSDADCVAGRACVNGSCGPKPDGQPCAAAGDCASNFCVDGFCCADACQGACRTCALPSALGRCTHVPAGVADPRQTCIDQTPASCGTDGKCDGAGSCRRYRPGTVCAPERCQNNVFTPESLCGASGACVAPSAVTCVPFTCNGSQCFGACTADANCSAGNVCVGNSCGKKPNGAFCSSGAECASSSCAQGVCCATTCTNTCRSCALPGTMGTCTNVPSGAPDPAQICVDRDATSCDTNGKCEAGTCQKYALGTPCVAASCPAGTTTLLRQSTCDGAGTCVMPAAVSCFPFHCGAATCKSTCAADADCAPPAVCNAGSCGLKSNGASCGTDGGGECLSGMCVNGVCCATACGGTCVSCALAGSEGTCTNVPAGGVDPRGQCTDQGPASCGTTGFCDGGGACQRYGAGTQCAAPVCPVGTATATLTRSCDGSGGCRAAQMLSCGSYACNGSTCNAACGSDADCSPGNVCDGGSCGKKRLGQMCTSGTECDSNNCVDGVCCSSAICGTCYSCSVPGLAGLCTPVPTGEMEPHNGCSSNPPCGFNGTCDGSGACRYAANGTSCGTASCSGSMFTPVGKCDGAGSCTQTAMSCGQYVCSAGACRTTCAGNGDCAAGFNCQSGSCTNLKPKGTTCASGPECSSGICADGVCCSTTCATGCFSCNLPSDPGTCQLVPAGADDPHDVCPTTAPAACGTNGRCDGVGGCTLYPAGTACSASMCVGMSSARVSACNGMGVCVVGSPGPCSPYTCNPTTGACRTACAVPADCAPQATCANGSCQPN